MFYSIDQGIDCMRVKSKKKDDNKTRCGKNKTAYNHLNACDVEK